MWPRFWCHRRRFFWESFKILIGSVCNNRMIKKTDGVLLAKVLMTHVFNYHWKLFVGFIGDFNNAVGCESSFEDSTFVVKVENLESVFCKVGLGTKEADFSLRKIEG